MPIVKAMEFQDGALVGVARVLGSRAIEKGEELVFERNKRMSMASLLRQEADDFRMEDVFTHARA